jgi:hypothetical protein
LPGWAVRAAQHYDFNPTQAASLARAREVDEKWRIRRGSCFLPIGDLPVGDVMLGQKIALETFESRALAATRNFTPNAFPFRPTRPLR